MSTITAIEPQQKRAGRYNIFVDGEFVIGVSEGVVADLSLRVGDLVTTEELRMVAAAEEVRKAIDSASGLLAVRARAEREIKTRLITKGYEEGVIGQAIEKLRDLGLLNDADFATQWVGARASATAGRPMGKRRLAVELGQKGVARDQVADALSQVSEDDELSMARAAAQKKVRKIPAGSDALQAERQKLIGFLQRRGFAWNVVKQITDETLGAHGAFDEDE